MAEMGGTVKTTLVVVEAVAGIACSNCSTAAHIPAVEAVKTGMENTAAVAAVSVAVENIGGYIAVLDDLRMSANTKDGIHSTVAGPVVVANNIGGTGNFGGNFGGTAAGSGHLTVFLKSASS